MFSPTAAARMAAISCLLGASCQALTGDVDVIPAPRSPAPTPSPATSESNAPNPGKDDPDPTGSPGGVVEAPAAGAPLDNGLPPAGTGSQHTVLFSAKSQPKRQSPRATATSTKDRNPAAARSGRAARSFLTTGPWAWADALMIRTQTSSGIAGDPARQKPGPPAGRDASRCDARGRRRYARRRRHVAFHRRRCGGQRRVHDHDRRIHLRQRADGRRLLPQQSNDRLLLPAKG